MLFLQLQVHQVEKTVEYFDQIGLELGLAVISDKLGEKVGYFFLVLVKDVSFDVLNQAPCNRLDVKLFGIFYANYF